jgi:hypothetical protein
MDQKKIEEIIQHGIGKIVTVTFGEHRETVSVVSADPDGFICRILAPRPGDNATEFWIAYGEVTSLTGPASDPA